MLETINGRPEFVLVFERFMVDTIRIREKIWHRQPPNDSRGEGVE